MIASAAPTGPRPGIAPSPAAPAAPAAAPPVAAAPEAPPASAAPTAPSPEPPASQAAEPPATLLGAAIAKPAEAPAAEGEKPAEAEAKPAAEAVGDEAPTLPAFEAFTLPEGFKADPEKLAGLQKELGEFELLTKAPHEEVQKLAQRMVDRHVAELQDTVKRIGEASRESVDKTVKGWREEFLADPQWGGNNRDTTVNAAADFIRTFGGPPERQQQIFNFLDKTGLGDHVLLLSLFAAAQQVKGEGGMLAATTAVPDKKSNVEKLYGGQRRR